jgi:SET and MYND domain-containing protein 4
MKVSYFGLSPVMLQILEKLYHSKHIIIAHELIKVFSILLSLGDRVSAVAAIVRAETIFLLYYGSDVETILPYFNALKGIIRDDSVGAP